MYHAGRFYLQPTKITTSPHDLDSSVRLFGWMFDSFGEEDPLGDAFAVELVLSFGLDPEIAATSWIGILMTSLIFVALKFPCAFVSSTSPHDLNSSVRLLGCMFDSFGEEDPLGDALTVEPVLSFGLEPAIVAISWICFLMTSFVLAALKYPGTFVSSILSINIFRVRSSSRF
jgi:hypothetical protein